MDDLVVTLDETEEMLLTYRHPDGTTHRARLPQVRVNRP